MLTPFLTLALLFPAQPDAKIVTVDPIRPVDLWNAYERNAAKADAKYLGKPVELAVTETDVGKKGGKYFIGCGVVSAPAMRASEVARLPERERRWFHEGYPPNVLLLFKDDQAGNLSKLGGKKRVKFTVTGTCKGTLDNPDVWQGKVIRVEDCEIRFLE